MKLITFISGTEFQEVRHMVENRWLLQYLYIMYKLYV